MPAHQSKCIGVLKVMAYILGAEGSKYWILC